jgi:hypothetical protein
VVPLDEGLFPQRIIRVTSVVVGGLVPVDNSSDAAYASDADGRQWVRKAIQGNELLAEAVGWLLSKSLDVPVPDAAIVGTGLETAWLSQHISSTTHWSPKHAQRMSDPDRLGAIIALDAILGNFDRNAGNLLFRSTDSDLVDVFSIDLAGCWSGSPKDFGDRGLSVPSVDEIKLRHARGIPIDMIRESALVTAQKASELGDRPIIESVDEACHIALEPERIRLQETLIRRCSASEELVSKYLIVLENLP